MEIQNNKKKIAIVKFCKKISIFQKMNSLFQFKYKNFNFF